MEIIGVAGNAHSVGKTTLARTVVSNLRSGVGVLKCSIHPGVERLVTAEPEFIQIEGTDTALFVKAGAEQVVFLRTDEENLSVDLRTALDMLGDRQYVLVEGNRVLNYLNPDLILYICRQGVESKPSAASARARADLLIDSDEFMAVAGQGTIPFEYTQSRITCSKAHLLGKVLGWNLAQVGQLIEEKGIKVKQCQLGLFK